MGGLGYWAVGHNEGGGMWFWEWVHGGEDGADRGRRAWRWMPLNGRGAAICCRAGDKGVHEGAAAADEDLA